MKQCIAIDIGGTKVKYGRINLDGTVLSNKALDSFLLTDAEKITKALCSIVEEELNPEVIGIGISTLGAIDEEKGMVTGACDNLPALQGIPIKEILTQKYNLPVHIMNDGNAAALGEAYFGAGKDISQFYCITIGTGIGGAYVQDKKVLVGANGLAGEIGYIERDASGKIYEEYASVKAFLGRCQSITGKVPDGIEAFSRSIEGDLDYVEIFDSWLKDLAKGIIDIIYLFDPGTIVIGGGISSYGEKLTSRISEAVEKKLSGAYLHKTAIIPARNNNVANMLGAVSCYFDI